MHSNDSRATSDGAVKELASALRALRVHAGSPSLRTIARSTDEQVSHTTAADLLAGKRVPSWPVVATIVRSLEGDEATFKSLWVAATNRSPAPTGSEREDDLFFTRYRRVVADFYNSSAPGGGASRGKLLDVYEQPSLVRLSGPAQQKSELDFATLDNEIRYALLLGPIASGKSMLCRALMVRHALNKTQPVAFLLPLRHFTAQAIPDRSVVGFLERDLESIFQMRPPNGLIERYLLHEDTLIIFDGLDELIDRDRLDHICSIIRLFSTAYPRARILITSADPSHRYGLFDSNIFTTYALGNGGSKAWHAALHGQEVVAANDEVVPHEVLTALNIIREVQARSVDEPAFRLHAVVWSWATLEKCLLGVLQEQEETRSVSTLRALHGEQLIDVAESGGLITRDDAERLRPSLALRNQLAHGQQPSVALANQLVDESVDAVAQAINHLYKSIASRDHPLRLPHV